MELTAPTNLLNKEQVCSRIYVSKRSLETMVNKGEFPPAVRLGKRDMWSDQAVEKWLHHRFEHQANWFK